MKTGKNLLRKQLICTYVVRICCGYNNWNLIDQKLQRLFLALFLVLLNKKNRAHEEAQTIARKGKLVSHIAFVGQFLFFLYSAQWS